MQLGFRVLWVYGLRYAPCRMKCMSVCSSFDVSVSTHGYCGYEDEIRSDGLYIVDDVECDPNDI